MFLTKTKPPTEVLDRKFRQHVTIGKKKQISTEAEQNIEVNIKLY